MDEWAKLTEARVRKALWETSRIPGPPPMGMKRHGRPWGLDQEVVSTEASRGITQRAGWIDPSPWKVYVFMECCSGPLSEKGFLADTEKGWRFMDRAIKRLLANEWSLEDAGWESYNAAVAYVWVKPRMIA